MRKASRTILKPVLHHVSLSGRFPPGWAGDFSHGLASRGFSIVNGFACRNPRGFWAAEFDLLGQPQTPALSPVEIDRLATVAIVRPALLPIRLHRYSLIRPTGSAILLLDVEAPDQIGFLAQILAHLAFLSLFPVEMRIETSRGVARDRLHLRSMAGSEPAERTLLAVRCELDRLVTTHANNNPSKLTLTP